MKQPSAMIPVIRIIRSRSVRLVLGFAGIAGIAFADIELDKAIPLALLYLVPITFMSSALSKWQIVLLGIFCTGAAELSDAFPWTVSQGIPRDVLYFFAYTAAGLYVAEALSRRRVEQTHVRELETEIDVRRGVEEQLRLVVANSSIAIITGDEHGTILEANEAAERLFSTGDAVPPTKLIAKSLASLLPALTRIQMRPEGWNDLRTMMQCQAIQGNGELFLADVWFSRYRTMQGVRLVAMIVDSSVEMRDREESNLEQVLQGSRLAIGALSHEVRNICAAISLVQQNLIVLEAPSVLEPNVVRELEALQKLVSALEHVTAVELSFTARQATTLLPNELLRDLHIIIQPSLREADIELDWDIAADLPMVWADPRSMIQVFLNLIRNAKAALAESADGRVCLSARYEQRGVSVKVSDNGPGVQNPEQLFRPFASPESQTSGKVSSGLGLYLSRAIMRSFYGDLRYEPTQTGATFVVELLAVEPTP